MAAQICTQKIIPDELQALADTLSIQENPLNGHQITVGRAIQGGGDPASLALPIGSLWQNGRALRVKLLNGSDKIKAKIRQYANLWTLYANITFDFVDSGDAEIRVNVDASNGSWSYVGTGNLSIPQDQPTMNYGWLTDNTTEQEFSRVIVHEFGHALGCIHEHQSPDAGIPWNKEAVYKYYEPWERATVDNNIFRLYSRDSTQFSDFDTGSIMLYAIPKELTTNGFSVEWNTQLSDGDKAFIAITYPGRDRDVSTFNTIEVRPWDKPAHQTSSSQSFSRKFNTPPSMAVGLNWLDVANKANLRAKAYVDDVKVDSAVVHIDSWADTTLYSAGCTWFRAAADDPEIQIGQYSTLDDHPWNRPQAKTCSQIKFKSAYAGTPKVVVWLNQLDTSNGANCRVKATATNVSNSGFTINLDSWADTVLYTATASWIAFPADKPGITGGSYSTNDVRPWNQPQLLNSGRVEFPAGKFQRTPKVLIALDSLDVDRNSNLRVKVAADSVSGDGMNWHIDGWADTVLYSAGASYLAFT